MPLPDFFDVADAHRRTLEATRKIIHAQFRRPPELTVSEWADKYRILPKTSPAPGRWRTDRTPYLRKIMDTASDIDVERLVWRKPAQVGGSECLLNILGYYIHQDPAPILLVQISTKEAEKFSKERVATMIADTPVLRRLVASAKSRDSENTIDSKKFDGGHLGIVGANAPSGLRSRPRRILLFDEVDGYPASAGNEGDPISLATKRLTAFWNSLEAMISTPTLAETSRIDAALKTCDVVYALHLPCPDCGHYQELEFENLRWEKTVVGGRKVHHPETAEYVCEECGVSIPERRKPYMLERHEWVPGRYEGEVGGKWVPHEPEGPCRKVGFQMTGLNSPWLSWGTIADEFLEAKDNPELLQVWVNTRLGDVWDDAGHQLDADPLLKRREEYASKLPERVVLITAGADVQLDRIEVEIVGWAPGEESWSLDYFRIPGDPSTGQIWADLDEVLQSTYEHPSGLRVRISATAIDSRYMTQQVLKFCKGRVARNVWPIHGVDGPGRPIIDRPSNKNKQRVPRYPVGVDTAKGVVYSRLQIEPEEDPTPGACHFPARAPYDEEFFRQLTSEKVVLRRTPRGELKRQWVRRPNRRAEVLDCRVYNVAALEGLIYAGTRLERLAEQLKNGPPKKRRRVRSKGID